MRTVAQLKERMSDVRLEDSSAVFNTELVAALELDNMLEVAEALAVSAAHRRESRGAHTRRDAPKRDDQNFLYHTLCYYGAVGAAPGQEARDAGQVGAGRAKVLAGAMSEQKKTFVVTRFDPDKDEAPRQQSYEVPVQPDWKVLDALNYIKDELDGTLSHRWSCRMAVCGSCGMMVNGKPSLTCKDALSTTATSVEVTPLANFPVVRDLVVEMDGFMEKLKAVKPWIIVAKERAVEEGTYRQSPEELEDFKQFSMCINCMLCYSACPVVGNEPEFLGPAAIALGHRYNMDSRDEGQAERNEIFRGEGTVFACSYANECSEVCPKHVDPRRGDQPGEVQRGDRLGDELRRAREEASSHGARRPPPRDDALAARPHAHRAAAGADRLVHAAAHAPLPAVRRHGHRLPAVRLRRAARGVDARQRPDRLGARSSRSTHDPRMIALHVVLLAAVIFVGVRFFGLFPKSQPAKIGPAKPPPRPIIHAMLYAAWIAVSGGLALIMAGGIF